MPHLSIIIPTFNEEKCIESTLLHVKACAPDAEILVVDGGSHDQTLMLAGKHTHVITAKRGRGGQLNAGVAATQGDILLFLHADTLPDTAGIDELLVTMQNGQVDGGAFRMRFDDTRSVYRRICANITQRSLRTRSYTGDQAIFARRTSLQKFGGYRDWPFMEDVEYSERMSKGGHVVLLESEVETSARRHQRWGLLRTQLTVVLIRVLYLLKVHPATYEWLWPPIR